jgi:hypothetical protein
MACHLLLIWIDIRGSAENDEIRRRFSSGRLEK